MLSKRVINFYARIKLFGHQRYRLVNTNLEGVGEDSEYSPPHPQVSIIFLIIHPATPITLNRRNILAVAVGIGE